jgi:hypothetical protein
MPFPPDGENWLPPPAEMPPPEIEVGLDNFTSFFFLFSRNSLALRLSAFGRDCDLERERLGLSLDGFRFRPCTGVSASSESSSSLSSSLLPFFSGSGFCKHLSVIGILGKSSTQ